MELRTAKAFSAIIDLIGLDTDDPLTYPPSATVTFDNRGRPDDASDVVGFEAMLVVAMMRACRTCPEVFEPFVDLVGEAAEVMLGLDEATAPTLCLRDHLHARPAAQPDRLDSIAVTLAAGIPRVGGSAASGTPVRVRADLKVPKRGGTPFVVVHSRNAYVTAFAVIATFEYVARTFPYDSVTCPVASALLRVLEMTEAMTRGAIPDFNQGTLLFAYADGLAAGDVEPAPRPTPHELAAALRRGIEDRLEDPEGKLSERSSRAAGQFADELTSTEADWYAATDALIVGYYLREVEREICEWNSFDPDYAEQIELWARSEPDIAFAAAALSVADGMPSAFAAGPEVWDGLSLWAADHALDRAWARHRSTIEQGAKPTIAHDGLGRAFALGYGLCFAEAIGRA